MTERDAGAVPDWLAERLRAEMGEARAAELLQPPEGAGPQAPEGAFCCRGQWFDWRNRDGRGGPRLAGLWEDGALLDATARAELDAGLPDILEIRGLSLPFLLGTTLVHLFDAEGRREAYLLWDRRRHDKALQQLDGKSPVIHEWNRERVNLFELESALEYLRYFCHFVEAEEGPFRILEPGHPWLAALVPDAADRATVEALITPLRVTHFGEQGDVFVNARVFYGDALFGADFAVRPDGRVEMLEDDPLWQAGRGAA